MDLRKLVQTYGQPPEQRPNPSGSEVNKPSVAHEGQFVPQYQFPAPYSQTSALTTVGSVDSTQNPLIPPRPQVRFPYRQLFAISIV